MAQSTLEFRHVSAKPPAKKASSFRPDIQGLRAVAVIAVILDHTFGYPSGGFVGVDIFFVLSGFLITGLMLKEHARTGRISFADFYRRRVRRIMPAALLVLAVTVAASWFLFIGERFRSILWDSLASALFAANWRFAITGTDYLQAEGPVSPLRHYWSLSVEEQFYVVWPLLLVVVLGLMAKRFAWGEGKAVRNLGIITAGVVGASLAFGAWETITTPAIAYFSTFSRAWELGIGAMLAIWTPALSRIPAAVRPALQWAGIAGIGASIFFVNTETPFPVPGAVLPVLSAALVIGGGVGGQRFMAPLTNRVSRYIGDISYSLYLWHFPAVVLIGAIFPPKDAVGYILILAATAVLSVLSFHFVEDPIRKSSWLESKRKKRNQSRNDMPWQLVGLGALAGVTAIVCTMALFAHTPSTATAVPLPASASASADASSAPLTPEADLASKVATALQTTTWPDLTPTLDDLGAGGFQKEDSEGCAPATPRGKNCTINDVDPARLAVVVGDSMGAAWLPSIKAALEPKGWTVRSMTYVGCAYIDAATATVGCNEHRAIVRSLIEETKPALVIMSNLYRVSSADTWTAAKTTAETEWTTGAGKVVTISAPPAGADPKKCVTRVATPKDCIAPIDETWTMNSAADEKVANAAGHTFIKTRDWFCVQNAGCPLFVDGTVVRRDQTHLTDQYAVKVAPLLAAQLAPIAG